MSPHTEPSFSAEGNHQSISNKMECARGVRTTSLPAPPYLLNQDTQFTLAKGQPHRRATEHSVRQPRVAILGSAYLGVLGAQAYPLPPFSSSFLGRPLPP